MKIAEIYKNLVSKINFTHGDSRRKTLIALLAVLVIALSGTGVLLAKYLRTNQGRAEMLSSNFHFSSNYLEEAEENASYQVSDWGSNSVQIQLYNYEKENVGLISDEAISYTVSVSAGWTVKVLNSGTELTADNGVYVLQPEDVAGHTLQVSSSAETVSSDPLTVTVTSTAPYKKVLTAQFELVGKKYPSYESEDMGDYCVVTIYSNDYSSDIYVNWANTHSPDNTNKLMSNWIDIPDNDEQAIFSLEDHTTYELIFVENQANVTSGKSMTDLTAENMVVKIGE